MYISKCWKIKWLTPWLFYNGRNKLHTNESDYCSSRMLFNISVCLFVYMFVRLYFFFHFFFLHFSRSWTLKLTYEMILKCVFRLITNCQTVHKKFNGHRTVNCKKLTIKFIRNLLRKIIKQNVSVPCRLIFLEQF